MLSVAADAYGRKTLFRMLSVAADAYGRKTLERAILNSGMTEWYVFFNQLTISQEKKKKGGKGGGLGML